MTPEIGGNKHESTDAFTPLRRQQFAFELNSPWKKAALPALKYSNAGSAIIM
jgi:hypothetical protein